MSRALTLAHALTLTTFLLASLLPHGRVWGLDAWAWLPPWVPWTLFAVGLAAAAPLPAALVRRMTATASRLPTLLTAGLLVVAGTAIFFALSTRYPFSGDGYQLLSDLSTGAPFVKSTGHGEGLLHLWAFRALGGGADAAERAYRGLSVGAGFLYLILAAIFARARFPDARDRMLCTGGLATGGFAVLFFGHVENYSVLALAVAGTCAVGTLAARGRVPAWTVLVPFAASAWLHELGWALAPGVAWLLLGKSSALRRIRGRSGAGKVRVAAAVGAVTVGAVFALIALQRSSLFLELTLLPVVPDRFTVDGYTLLSPPHLIDLANLLLLLLPGLPVLVVAATVRPAGTAKRDATGTDFLAVLTAGCWAAVAVLDPKLGMARDWDAFAFAGVPLTFLLVVAALGLATPAARRGVALASVLGALAVAPRAAAARLPDAAVARFRSTLELDRTRGRNGWLLLVGHYERAGDASAAAAVREEWERRYPERALVREAQRLDDAGDVAGAIRKNREALRWSPQYFDAYNNLGVCFYRTGDLAQAREMLEIAAVLNPGANAVHRNLATVFEALGDSRAAERERRRAEALAR